MNKGLKNLSIVSGVGFGYSLYLVSLYGLNRFYDGDVPLGVSLTLVGGILFSSVGYGVYEKSMVKLKEAEKDEEKRKEMIGRIMGSVLEHKVREEVGQGLIREGKSSEG